MQCNTDALGGEVEIQPVFNLFSQILDISEWLGAF